MEGHSRGSAPCSAAGMRRASPASASVEQHRRHAAREGSLRSGVVTVSDQRTESDDASGCYLMEQLASSGHSVVRYRIVANEPPALEAEAAACLQAQCDVVFFSGGTGLSRRDRTYETLQPRFDRELVGFGELFRWLSFREIGSAAMLSRATAGVIDHTLVFLLPGSPNAVRLAWERLIEPELLHVIREVRR